MLDDGWVLNNDGIPSLSIPERSPTLHQHLERGNYDELSFLQRVFSTKISVNNILTSFFQILKTITNTNLKLHCQLHNSKKSNKRHLSVSDKLLWRFMAMKLVNNLAERGKIKHIEEGLYQKVNSYIGKNRFKVLNLICLITI